MAVEDKSEPHGSIQEQGFSLLTEQFLLVACSSYETFRIDCLHAEELVERLPMGSSGGVQHYSIKVSI